MGSELKDFPHTADQREFMAALVAHGQLDEGRAKDVGHQLVRLQTCHRWLCAKESAGEPLTFDPQDMEGIIEVRAKETALVIPGVKDVLVSGDARGSTLRLAFTDGHADSLTGAYNVPTDEDLYARMEAGEDITLHFPSVDHHATPSP